MREKSGIIGEDQNQKLVLKRDSNKIELLLVRMIKNKMRKIIIKN